MALVIAQQPATDDLMAAYNPVPFIIYANQPTSGAPCPVVYADVYFDSVYYGTFSATIYHAIVGPYAEYHFDIQDKVQEYLRSRMLISGSVNNGVLTDHSSPCFVRFRETDIDADGFTISVGTAPIQGTFFTAPVDGTGTESDHFFVLNSHLKHSDHDIDLLTHLKRYSPSFAVGTDLGWNISHRPNEVPVWGYKNGGGKYYICPLDHDVMAWFTYTDFVTPGSTTITCSVTYKNGTTASQNLLLSSLPQPFIAGVNNTYYMNGGITFMEDLFPTLSFVNVEHYTVYIYGFLTDYFTQRYYVKSPGCCNNRIRIHFQNLLGGWDAINFDLVQEVNKTDSALYQKPKSLFPADITANKKDRGLGRFQPKQTDIVECYTEDYVEADMTWVKELLGSAQAFYQIPGSVAMNPFGQWIPIVILDSEIVTLKKDDSFVYNVTIKFQYANETINLRS